MEAVALQAADEPLRALQRFAELLKQIGKVKYYRPRNLRLTQPWVSKRQINKWIKGRAVRINVAYVNSIEVTSTPRSPQS